MKVAGMEAEQSPPSSAKFRNALRHIFHHVSVFTVVSLNTGTLVGGQRQAPAALLPGKIRYPLYRRLGEPQGRSGLVRKISPPTGIRSPDRPARSESLYQLSCPDPQEG
jgi:hypothetical protein